MNISAFAERSMDSG